MHYTLGIEVVVHCRGEILFSQMKYLLNLITETSILDVKPTETPMEQNVKFNCKDSTVFPDKRRYRSFHSQQQCFH